MVVFSRHDHSGSRNAAPSMLVFDFVVSTRWVQEWSRRRIMRRTSLSRRTCLNLAGLLGTSAGLGPSLSAAAPQAPATKKRDWHAEEFKVLVTLGESTTAGGWSTDRSRCWASRLARLI